MGRHQRTTVKPAIEKLQLASDWLQAGGGPIGMRGWDLMHRKPPELRRLSTTTTRLIRKEKETMNEKAARRRPPSPSESYGRPPAKGNDVSLDYFHHLHFIGEKLKREKKLCFVSRLLFRFKNQ